MATTKTISWTRDHYFEGMTEVRRWEGQYRGWHVFIFDGPRVQGAPPWRWMVGSDHGYVGDGYARSFARAEADVMRYIDRGLQM